MTGSFIIADISNKQLPLFGRDWLMELQLDWHKMLHCHAMHKMQGESLQQEFPSVFKEELGLLVEMEAEIELKEGSKPKFLQESSHSVCTT